MRCARPTTRCSGSRRSTGSSRPPVPDDATTATLLDQRDVYIDQLAQLMDISVVAGDHNQVIGLHQFRHPAGRHRGVDARVRPAGLDDADAQWSADPTQRTVGTIVAERAERRRRRSDRQQCDPLGRDRGLSRDARPDVLVQAQTQLDEIAAGDGARAVRPDRRRHAVSLPARRRASTSTSAACSTAIRSASPIPTTLTGAAAHAHAGAGRRSRGAAAVELRRPPIRTTG